MMFFRRLLRHLPANPRRLYTTKPTNCAEEKTPLLKPSCKVAVITGGAEGIGLATARQLLCCKANHVVLLGLDTDKGLDAVNSLHCSFGKNKATFMKCDVKCRTSLSESLLRTKNEFPDVQMFVNCAGMWNESDWKMQLETNLIGTINFNLGVFQTFARNTGIIINLAGVPGLEPFPMSPIYSSENAAIIRFTENFGHADNMKMTGMRCVALCTGITSCTEFLANVEKTMPCPHMTKGVLEYMKEAHRQKPEVVANAILELIRHAQSGTVWVVESSRLHNVNVPNWREFRTLVAQYT